MSAAIVAVLSVEDTREYVEDGDRWRAVPGSGIAHDCDRCGRSHEVHALVQLADGSAATVGTSCMTRESVEMRAELARLAGRAKTGRRLEAQMRAARARLARAEARTADVYGLTPPPVRERHAPTDNLPRRTAYWCEGGPAAYVLDPRGESAGEGVLRAVAEWRRAQTLAADPRPLWLLREDVAQLEAAIARRSRMPLTP